MLNFPRTIWILFAGTLINRFGSFVLVFLILYLTRNGYSAAQAGLVVASYGVGGMAASIVGGHLADRIGRRNAIAVSMFTAAASILALSQAHGLVAITLLTAATGLTAELYRPASSALLMDLTEPGDRVRVFAGYRLAINVGAMAGPAVGGFIAERSFQLLFVGDAMTCVLFGIIALVALPHGVRSGTHTETQGAARTIFSDRPFMIFLVASTFVAFVYAQAHSGFALHLSANGFSNATYGMLIALNGALVLLLELPLTRWTQRQPARPIMALGMLLVGVGFGLTLWAPTVALLAGTVLIWTLGEIIGAPVASAYVAELAPERMRGRYQGAWTLTFGLGYVLGPALGGRLFGWGPAALWLTCLAAGVAAAVLILYARPTGPVASAESGGAEPAAVPPIPTPIEGKGDDE